jgi:DNA-binding MarR family transcriptional regulator
VAVTRDRYAEAVLRKLHALRARASRGAAVGDLAEMLGLDRAAVRQALIELAKRGLVERDVAFDQRAIAVLWSARRPEDDERVTTE